MKKLFPIMALMLVLSVCGCVQSEIVGYSTTKFSERCIEFGDHYECVYSINNRCDSPDVLGSPCFAIVGIPEDVEKSAQHPIISAVRLTGHFASIPNDMEVMCLPPNFDGNCYSFSDYYSENGYVKIMKEQITYNDYTTTTTVTTVTSTTVITSTTTILDEFEDFIEEIIETPTGNAVGEDDSYHLAGMLIVGCLAIGILLLLKK